MRSRSRSRSIKRVAFDLNARATASVGTCFRLAGPGTDVHGPLSGEEAGRHCVITVCSDDRCRFFRPHDSSSGPSARPNFSSSRTLDALCRSAIAKCRRLLPGTIRHCHHFKSKHGPSLDPWAVARTCLLRSSKQNATSSRIEVSVKLDAESILMRAAQGTEVRERLRISGSLTGPGLLKVRIPFYFLFQISHDLKS